MAPGDQVVADVAEVASDDTPADLPDEAILAVIRTVAEAIIAPQAAQPPLNPCAPADLERGLPIADSSVDHLFAVHVLEHIRELVVLMNEIHRVLKRSGVLHVLAAKWQHPNAVGDPTHVRLLTIDTFKYFCLPHPGIKPFLPLSISATADTLYADLQAVKDGEPLISENQLSWYFGC
jgi:SAM-dependent methyltransferase